MVVYPYSSPIILTDSIYVAYGGQTGTMSSAQRNAAYLIAEKRATNYLGTFLLPTVVTGTYPYKSNNFIITEYGYVQSIKSAKLLSANNLNTCELSSTDGCVFIFEDTFGYLNFSCIQTQCNCAGWSWPYQYQIAYEAGLPTGTASQPDVLLALTMIAQETLNEMTYPSANETAGAQGVEAWSSLEYSEKRKPWAKTSLGASAQSAFAAGLLKSAVKRAIPYIGLRNGS